ncbi:CBS domain-containing protein [candidate division KSB1 bacterium]|nr:CBS domain-containing protein [candidate division KSB1 bacterium]MBL7092465.1 CBS domain-containing protein [candidate division KSB1 bacterium]
MKVKEILKTKGPEVITIGEEKTVKEALASLVKNNIGSLIVINEDGKITGIITERDILKECNKKEGKLGELIVKDVMTKDLIIGEADDEVESVEVIMTENRVRHLPILSQKRLVGIISIGDVVKGQIQESQVENRYLKDYIEGKYLP